MKEQLHYILEKLAIKNDIRFNQEELKLQLLSHPSYPSLHSLTGVLSHFGIENIALRVPANEATFAQLPFCFIADVTLRNDKQLALIEKDKNNVKITFDEKEKEVISLKDFLSRWSGVVLAIEKNEEDKAFESPRSNSLKGLLGFAICLSVSYFIVPHLTLFSGGHFLLSLVGLVLSVLIVQHDLGMQSGLANHFCQLSERTSCDAVLQSGGAKLLGQIKLSDISIVVFATYNFNWLLIFMNGITNHQLIAIVGLLAAPFIVYSLYYQYWIVKKWCPLCIGIATVLSLQFILVLIAYFPMATLAIALPNLLFFIISLLTSIGVWYSLKPLLEDKIHSEKNTIKYLQLKRNFVVFNALYQERTTLSTALIPTRGEIILGNKSASVEILVITNPLCYYCKHAHHDIERLLERASAKIKVIIRFNVNVSNKESEDYQVAARLLQIHSTHNENDTRTALNEIYDEAANLKEWIAKHEGEIKPSIEEILTNHKQWCQTNEINFTPAFYVNEKLFPLEYEKTDLLYFVDDLIELEEENAIQSIATLLPPIIKKKSS